MFNNLCKIETEPQSEKPPSATDASCPPAGRPKSPAKHGFFPARAKSRSPMKSPVVDHKNDDDGDEHQEPQPRPLISPSRALSLKSNSTTAAAAAASSSSSPLGPGSGKAMNLRTTHALSDRTNQLRERREEILQYSPMNRVVFVQRVSLFASTSIARACELSYVSSTWQETVRVYNENFLWRRLVRDREVNRTAKTKFDAVGDHSETYNRAYELSRGVPGIIRPPPPSLGNNNVGVKTLFALAGSLEAELPWLVFCLVSTEHGGVDPNVENSSGWSPLIFAASHGLVGTVEILLEHGAKISKRTLDAASRNRRSEILQMLLRTAKERQQLEALCAGGNDQRSVHAAPRARFPGDTPDALPSLAHRAAQEGGDEGVQMLQFLADTIPEEFNEMLFTADANGNSPLHLAVLEDRDVTANWIANYQIATLSKKQHSKNLFSMVNRAGERPCDIVLKRGKLCGQRSRSLLDLSSEFFLAS